MFNLGGGRVLKYRESEVGRDERDRGRELRNIEFAHVVERRSYA